jgi:chromosome segregation ATPase
MAYDTVCTDHPADVKEIGMPSKSIIGWIVVLMVLTALVACQSTYYAVWEKMGKEKRHLLRDQVEKARDDQAQASEEFKDALTRLKEMYGFDGGDLEKMYNQLSDDYETCQDRAEQIDERIENVKQIAKDLFSEWRKEIDEIQNADFRSKSNQKLQATRTRYNRLENAMLTARKRMTPVLTNLHDYVLYLKHNLNAQAIGALKGEVSGIQTDVDRLMLDIRKSIDAADTFLAEFEK